MTPPGAPAAAVPGMAHEILIVGGSAYSMAGPNTGLQANLCNPWHYPVEALCQVCHQVVRREEMDPATIDWLHTGRMPGDPR